MNLRFLLALWAGKTVLSYYKRKGRRQSDQPGVWARHLCPNFLKYVKKPPLTVVVTGTNGKTSLTGLAAAALSSEGLRVAYNDWGANHHAGLIRCMLDAVDLFGRVRVDAALLECDELIIQTDLPLIRPGFLVVNNLARDSMFRNAHPGFVAGRIRAGVEQTPQTRLILNGDDPLLAELGEGRRLVFGVEAPLPDAPNTLIDDFSVCPHCGGKIEYARRIDRQLGLFSCPRCGFASPEKDFAVTRIGEHSLCLREREGEFTYPLPSPFLHQIYNTTAVIALLRAAGRTPEQIARALSRAALPECRETATREGGCTIYTQICKSQNPTGVSTAFRGVREAPGEKEILFLVDEDHPGGHSVEPTSYLYDSDYELLHHPSIRRIVLVGERSLDQKLRLLLAGVPEERIVCRFALEGAENDLLLDREESIYILHDVYCVTRARRAREAVAARIARERSGQHEN